MIGGSVVHPRSADDDAMLEELLGAGFGMTSAEDEASAEDAE